MLVMNSLAFFRLPLKVGHVPKRLVGVGADAIVGGSDFLVESVILGLVHLVPSLVLVLSILPQVLVLVRLRIQRRKGQLLSLAVRVVLDLVL